MGVLDGADFIILQKLIKVCNMKRCHVILVNIMWFSTVFACETFRFVTHDKKALQDHVILTMTTPYHQVCWSECAATIDCLSVNTRSLVDLGVILCELNNSSMRADPSKLRDHPEYQYHEMTNTNQCNVLECIRKEALEDGWYRFGDTAVKLINEKKTWDDAKAHCKSLGSDLVTIFSPRKNDFIRHVVVKDIFLTDEQNKESLLPSEVVDYWPLDGSDFDVIPRDKPGDARYELTDNEMSLYLSGHSSFAEVPAVVFNPEGFTTMLWIKCLNNTLTIVHLYSDWYFLQTFAVAIHYPYKGLFTWFADTAGQIKSTYYLHTPFEKWLHVAVTYNRTLRETKIYYNGTFKQKKNYPNAVLLRQTKHKYFHLGLKGDGWPKNPKTFHGYMKHLMVFNRTLDETEIKKSIAFVKLHTEPWIGLKGNSVTKTYQWTDGIPPSFLDMVPYKPGTGCVAMADTGQWFDTDCQSKARPFVCEKYAP